jgi:hypothetical protein
MMTKLSMDFGMFWKTMTMKKCLRRSGNDEGEQSPPDSWGRNKF